MFVPQTNSFEPTVLDVVDYMWVGGHGQEIRQDMWLPLFERAGWLMVLKSF